MTPSWFKVFSTDSVRRLAGPPAFARGAGYHREGRVEQPVLTGDRLRAVVRGSLPYTVDLWALDGEPGWSCSCPVGDDGLFCKHCVAVVLAVEATPDEPLVDGGTVQAGGGATLREYVLGLGVERLAVLVLEAAARDWRLREQLAAEAAAVGTTVDVVSWRRRIDRAVGGDGFVPYAEAQGWARGVEDVIDALEQLVDAGHADAVVSLAEHAHRRGDAAMAHVDDSDGWLSLIAKRLAELHVRACERAAPDPVALARRLVELELTSELPTFHRAAVSHAGVLGSAGIAEYRRRLESRWQAVATDGDEWSSARVRAREAMVAVALAAGDPDELVRVRQRDLRVPDDYGEVVRSLIDAGRDDEAVEWARRGLDAFVDRPWQTGPLRELLAGLLRDRGDDGAAIDLYWAAFDAHPSVGAYRALLAEVEGRGSATLWRQRAIAALRTRAAAAADGRGGPRRRPPFGPTPVTALIEILLDEGDVDGAWRVAGEHGCDQRLWLTLARAREAEHPLDAVPVYEREALAQIAVKDRSAYRSAVGHLTRIHRLCRRAGEPERFDRLVARIRAEHKLKRSLMGMLDQKGW